MEKTGLPNFLIVGTAKAGTTAIAYNLAQHPEIFFSPIKEPKFFSSQFIKKFNGHRDDFADNMIIRSLVEYKKLFKKARDEKAIGEASTENLYYHEKAIPLIKRYLGDVKILIILRNPIDRAYSAYRHLIRDSREKLSFEDALKEEDSRIRKNWEFLWHYKKGGLYYEAVKDYRKNFTHVKVMLYDYFTLRPVRFMKDIFDFLGVRKDFTPTLGRHNVSGTFRSKLMQGILKPSAFFGIMFKFLVLNGMFPEKFFMSIPDRFKKNKSAHKMMDKNTREYLKKYYKEDIIKLKELTGLPVMKWLWHTEY